MVHFVGAGPGSPDLITVRGKQYLEEADVIIYAGSLVNPQLLEYSTDVCTIHNSAKMTLEEVIAVMERAEAEGKMTVRLHTGDPCIYGAIREQMDILDEKGIAYDYCPTPAVPHLSCYNQELLSHTQVYIRNGLPLHRVFPFSHPHCENVYS